jgi:disulfide oxidoreductase YuzD
VYVIWDPDKDAVLRSERNISFAEISERILNREYIDIIENPARENQQLFVLPIKNYTWIVPFVIDEEERIVLKTAFKSRKFHRIYGGKK